MLDPITRAQIWHVLLDRARTAGLGLLAISHDDALLNAVTDRTLDLDPVARRPSASAS